MIKMFVCEVLTIFSLIYFSGCTKDDSFMKGIGPISDGDFYVATWGNDTSSGSFDKPWATWRKAFATAEPGDIIYFRGGTYIGELHPDTWQSAIVPLKPEQGIGHSGTADAPICFFNYPGEYPRLDCSEVIPKDYITVNNIIDIEYAQYIHFKGLEVFGYRQYRQNNISQGFSIAGANLTFENCIVHDIGGRGFAAWSAAWNDFDGPNSRFSSDTTRFINCDSYNICDELSSVPGNAGDGWKVHTYIGNVYSWEGCRAWNYSDDGIDPSGQGLRIFDHCWVMSTDKYSNLGHIEGNGIKVTGTGDMEWEHIDKTAPTVIIKNCLAAFCVGVGFYNNIATSYSNNALIFNNTAYSNNIGFLDYKTIVSGHEGVKYKNNISYSSTDEDLGYPFNVAIYDSPYIENNNSWKWINGWPWFEENILLTDDDFISLIPKSVTGPRKADGSLPDISFLKLQKGSALVNAGVDVGLPYKGSAPDLGAFESDW
jgi:hypothetical protein